MSLKFNENFNSILKLLFINLLKFKTVNCIVLLFIYICLKHIVKQISDILKLCQYNIRITVQVIVSLSLINYFENK